MPYIMTLVSLFTADSLIKYHIEKNWKSNQHRNDEKTKFKKSIIIKKYHNKGAILNIGDKNQSFVAVLSLVFSAFVTGIFVATLGRQGKSILKMGLALILGGAYSNTYDRLKRKYVVDYFSFSIDTRNLQNKFLQKCANKFSTIVFNLADFGIMLGAMLFVISEYNSGQD